MKDIDKYLKKFEREGNLKKLDKKYFDKFREEVNEIIEPLRERWKEFSESEIEILMKKFGEMARSETSRLRQEILSEPETGNALLEIGREYSTNNKIAIEIVSSIDNLHERYELPITDAIFEFLLEQTKNKKVNFYVSLFITELPQFKSYEKRYNYILSIPNISPKKKSMNTFYTVIKDNLKDIPKDYKISAAKIFKSFLDNSNLHEATVKKYSDIINELTPA